MEEIDKIPVFFIVGRPRSGTTLLRTLFDAHPAVSIPSECKFILDLYPEYGKKTDWKEKDLLGFYDDLLEQWRFDTWTIDREKLKEDLLACAGKAPYSRICKVVYLRYESFFTKDRIIIIGDKNPGYTIYTRRLREIFPGAKFIHILRDYRDNFVSVKDVDFELPIPSLVATKWKLFYRNFRKASLSMPENYRTIRYEDLVSDPAVHLQELCNFLGLEYHAEVLDFHEKKDDVFKAYPKEFITRYHANLLNKVNKSRTGVWKTKLSEKEIRLADLAVGKVAEEAGFQREYKGFNLWLYMQALPGILLAHALATLTVIVDKFPYRLRMTILNQGPIVVAKTFLRIFKPGSLK
jgi:hypothetical protein